MDSSLDSRKHNRAHRKLSEQLKERKAMRKYVALVQNRNIKRYSGVTQISFRIGGRNRPTGTETG